MIFTSCSVSSRQPPCLSDTRIVFFLNRHFCSYLYKDKKIGYDFCLTFIFCNYITSYLLLCSKKKKEKRKSWFAVDTLPFCLPCLYENAGKQKWGVFFFSTRYLCFRMLFISFIRNALDRKCGGVVSLRTCITSPPPHKCPKMLKNYNMLTKIRQASKAVVDWTVLF